MLFVKNGKYYIIEKDIGESIDQFYERGYFVINILNKMDLEKTFDGKDKLKEAIKFSRLWINVKYKHCSYSKEIMEKIQYFEN